MSNFSSERQTIWVFQLYQNTGYSDMKIEKSIEEENWLGHLLQIKLNVAI
jgi:hypothetical protein